MTSENLEAGLNPEIHEQLNASLEESAPVASSTVVPPVITPSPKKRSNALGRIPVHIQIVLGETIMSIGEVGELDCGSVIRLNRKIGEPVEILVNGKLFGKGEIAVLESDEARFAISITELASQSEAEA